ADANPIPGILWLLAFYCGLPFLSLSATGPLLQVWFLRAFPGKSPYKLYAFSNAGSLIGLISVPFFLELWFTTTRQASLWYLGFLAFSVMTIACAITALRQPSSAASGAPALPSGANDLLQHRVTPRTVNSAKPRRMFRTPRAIRRLWFLLAMVPAVMLAAVTTKLTTDVSPVPFLWIVPLTIYLVSLIICFSADRLAVRRFWAPISGLFLLASGVLICLQNNFLSFASLPVQFAVHLGTLTSVCMVCHGELIRLKPNVHEDGSLNDQLLTDFYLVMALGGAAGGLFTAVIAPVVFPFQLEHHVGLLASALVPALVVRHEEKRSLPKENHKVRWWLFGIGVLLLSGLIGFDISSTLRESYSLARSFFGVSRVIARMAPGSANPIAFELVHGTTRHGFQFVDPELARLPTAYYGPTSGVGIALQSHCADKSRSVGVVGLGVGTIAAYGRPGDIFDFYEIDPVVRDLASNFFRYLSDCPASVKVIPGDARLALENNQPLRPYDLLVLDAFSSDAVPVHLLTAEAFDIYHKRLAPDGIVAVHISSQNFDLRPVLSGHVTRMKWSSVCIVDMSINPKQMTVPSFWVLMSPQKSVVETSEIARAQTVPMTKTLDWTDDNHSLFRILGRPSL
ncbi:MAG: fused MFS/spermidine synthase, partial [Planctomycetaceae bacterium]|nr:fused MFS/spermidine synthase [Planctomycetaceae bacterium]